MVLTVEIQMTLVPKGNVSNFHHSGPILMFTTSFFTTTRL